MGMEDTHMGSNSERSMLYGRQSCSIDCIRQPSSGADHWDEVPAYEPRLAMLKHDLPFPPPPAGVRASKITLNPRALHGLHRPRALLLHRPHSLLLRRLHHG